MKKGIVKRIVFVKMWLSATPYICIISKAPILDLAEIVCSGPNFIFEGRRSENA